MATIVAYTYEAAAHCVSCASVRFGETYTGFLVARDMQGPRTDAVDREGNPVRHVFSTDEESIGYCDTCGDAYP